MLHRVVVDVIEDGSEIILVEDAVLPETGLPDIAVAALPACQADSCPPRAIWDAFGKGDLHPADSARIVRISPRQGPHEMRVIWEHDRRVNREWVG